MVISVIMANEFWPGVHDVYSDDCITDKGMLKLNKSQFPLGLKQPRYAFCIKN